MVKAMKVLFDVHPSLFDGTGKKGVAGGPKLFSKLLIRHLRTQGYSFVALSLRSKIELGDICELKRKKLNSGVWLYAQTGMNVAKILQASPRNVKSLTMVPLQVVIDILKQENPDVVLLNGYSLYNWYLLTAAHKLGIPVVVSHHGLWFKEVGVIPSSNSKTIRIVKYLEREISKKATKEIFLNDFSCKVYRDQLNVMPKKNSVIIPIPYNPIFLKTNSNSRAGKYAINIGFVGRWDPIKNPDAVLKVAREARRLKKGWQFYAVTQVGHRNSLKKIEQGFRKELVVIGSLMPTALKSFFGKMNLLILPSEFDVSPTVVLEAALQNKGTIISPHVGWVSDYRKYGLDDWISDFKNPGLVIKRIESLLSQELPKPFLKHLKGDHNPAKILNLYTKILREVTKKGKI